MQSAIERGRSGEVMALLDGGYDLNARLGPAELTPLKLAVMHRRLELARALLDRGAEVNLRRNDTSALTLAVIDADLPMIDLLLSRGAEVGPREVAWARSNGSRALATRLEETAEGQALRRREEARVRAAAALGVSTGTMSRVDEPSYRVGERPDDFALVVGIERYLDAPAARFAEHDALAVRAHLEAMGWPARNIVVLTGEQAGRAGLERYLERWLPNNVLGNGRVFFYFAGDGAADPATGRAFLLPWDGDASQLEATGYPLRRLYEKLTALKAREVVAVVDAGFSGAGERTAIARRASRPVDRVDFEVASLGDVVLLSSSSKSGKAGVLEEDRHGALTHSFLQGLNGAALGPGGTVTIKSLARAIERSAGAGSAELFSGPLGEADLRLR